MRLRRVAGALRFMGLPRGEGSWTFAGNIRRERFRDPGRPRIVAGLCRLYGLSARSLCARPLLCAASPSGRVRRAGALLRAAAGNRVRTARGRPRTEVSRPRVPRGPGAPSVRHGSTRPRGIRTSWSRLGSPVLRSPAACSPLRRLGALSGAAGAASFSCSPARAMPRICSECYPKRASGEDERRQRA